MKDNNKTDELREGKLNKTKQAVLIIAHDNIEVLEKTIQLLNDERVDIFVQIDASSDLARVDVSRRALSNSEVKSYISVCSDMKINWGGLSSIRAELALFERAKKYSTDCGVRYSHYHLISGSDMPIKPVGEFCDFFEKHQGEEFVHFFSGTASSVVARRYTLYHFFVDCKLKRKNKICKGIYKAYHFLETSMQEIMGVRRSFWDRYAYGANWVSITDGFLCYLLSQKEKILECYRSTYCCDEIFLQTCLINSPFVDRLYNKKFDDNYDACKRLIDWTRGVPYTFRESDFNEIISSNMFFVRKISYKADPELADRLFDYVKRKRETSD